MTEGTTTKKFCKQHLCGMGEGLGWEMGGGLRRSAKRIGFGRDGVFARHASRGQGCLGACNMVK